MTRAITGDGTDELTWQGDDRLIRLPAFEPPDGPVLVVAAHPDDEVLGVGGLLAQLSGRELRLLVLTDGEASHPGSPTTSPDRLAEQRVQETARARHELGLAGAALTRTRLPDSALRVHDDAVRQAVDSALSGAGWCLAPWRRDGHPDHETAGEASASVCAARGVPLVEYPIWLWQWADPRDADVPWPAMRAVRLAAPTLAAKRRAAARLRTQVAPLSADPADAPILGPARLDRLLRATETVIVG